MNTKTVIVHCDYAQDGRDIAELLRESFRVFLQKELGMAPLGPQDGAS